MPRAGRVPDEAVFDVTARACAVRQAEKSAEKQNAAAAAVDGGDAGVDVDADIGGVDVDVDIDVGVD